MQPIPPAMVPLNSLRCHKVIRARIGDMRFASLVRDGFAMRRYFGDEEVRCDYVLTKIGQNHAKQWLTPFQEDSQ